MLRNQEQVARLHHLMVQRHNRLMTKLKYSVNMSPPAEEALRRGAERAAGFIQALEWVRHPEHGDPEWMGMLDRLIDA
ncbi:hypothetical protein LCGC14_0461680 [marine sediment metagenome]|uniref:Uncharacterized protein n=1 Tax=marine sediment metagenome TaxID=412755 RepID=A0A0F9SEY5_9ZZZZ